MAEHPMGGEKPVIMKTKQIKVHIQQPGENGGAKPKKSVVSNAPKVSDGKRTVGQKLSKYAFGEEIEKPAEYVWESYLAPTGKRVANDIVEHFLMLLKHTFQRWIWNGKTLDDGKWMDRTSFSRISSGGSQQPIKARVMMGPVKELTFTTRIDAENVLQELKSTIANEGGSVTVRQYYEAGGCPELCEQGVSSRIGWDNLDKVEIKEHPNGEGFYLNLPRPINLSAG